MDNIKEEVSRQCKTGKSLQKLQKLATITNNHEVADACSEVYKERYRCSIKYVAEPESLTREEIWDAIVGPFPNSNK